MLGPTTRPSQRVRALDDNTLPGAKRRSRASGFVRWRKAAALALQLRLLVHVSAFGACLVFALDLTGKRVLIIGAAGGLGQSPDPGLCAIRGGTVLADIDSAGRPRIAGAIGAARRRTPTTRPTWLPLRR
jgi:hypothetical protein